MKNKENEEIKEETLKVKVTSETLEELLSLIKEKGWGKEDGFRIILGAGYGYLLGNPNIKDNKQTGLPKNSEQIIERLVKAEARLGSIRYRAYETQQANITWELSTGAVHKENIGLRNIAKRRLKEMDDLRSRLIIFEDENESLRKIIKGYEEKKKQLPISKNLFEKIKDLIQRN